MSAPGTKATMQPNEVGVQGAPADVSLSVPAQVISSGRPRALVADDDPVTVAMMQRVLTRKGFDVATAQDGEEAWVLASSVDFHVILTDIEMPRASGLELFDGIRATKPHVPFIFVTGRPTLESAVEVMNKGAIAYLPKPFEPEQVYQALERAMKEFSAPMSTRTTGRGATQQFGLALAGLHLHYQPIVRWSTRTPYAYEALMRTSYSEVPHPGVFLDLAEGLGRVHELGRMVRSRAASDVVDLPGAPELVFVNLHPEELQDDDLFDPSGPLASVAERFCLEITERESLSKLGDALDRIRALKHLGFKIAIDDLGAGYSGLNSFVDLEPDLIKVDMGLVRGIDTCARRQKLVSSLVSLARELDIDVIAEGVETEAELATLVEYQCDLFQGYLFSRPGPPFVAPYFPDGVSDV